MFGPLDNSLWCAEFILELIGAILVFRNFRSIKVLWLYLAFRASADVLSFWLSCGWGRGGYAWADYAQRMIQYVILAALAMRAIGAAVNADRRTVRLYGTIAALFGTGVILAEHTGDWTAYSLLQIGARADLGLAALVGGALLLREIEVIVAPLQKPWGWICSGLLTALVVHGAASMLLSQGMIGYLSASRLMACGQLAGLSVWIIGMARPTVELIAIRIGLGHEVPAGTKWLDESAKMEC